MQPVPSRLDEREPSKTQPAELRIPKTKAELLLNVVTSVRFWGGLSVLVALISLALPWWGVTTSSSVDNSSWGLFFGPQLHQTPVVFLEDRLDAAFAVNYSFMTGLVIMTALATALASLLRRALVLTTSLVISVIAILAFLGDVGSALSNECANTGTPAPCISGLVGQGISGYNSLDVVSWGFQAGFYTFIASVILLLGTLAIALQTKKS